MPLLFIREMASLLLRVLLVLKMSCRRRSLIIFLLRKVLILVILIRRFQFIVLFMNVLFGRVLLIMIGKRFQRPIIKILKWVTIKLRWRAVLVKLMVFNRLSPLRRLVTFINVRVPVLRRRVNRRKPFRTKVRRALSLKPREKIVLRSGLVKNQVPFLNVNLIPRRWKPSP